MIGVFAVCNIELTVTVTCPLYAKKLRNEILFCIFVTFFQIIKQILDKHNLSKCKT